MIRVAQVVRPATGGMRRHVSQLLAGLDTERFESLLCAPADFTLDAQVRDAPRFNVAIGARFQPIADLHAIASLRRRLLGTKSASNESMRAKVDLVHAHGIRGALIGVIAAQSAGLPAIFTAHNIVVPVGFIQRTVLRSVAAKAKVIVCVSQAVADSLVAVGVTADKIRIIPNGIDLAEFDRFDMPADSEAVRAQYGVPQYAPLIVAAGRLSHEKGFDVLLEAFKIVHEQMPEAHLLLAGSGSEEPAIRAIAESNVHLCGQIIDTRGIFAIADVVAIPSRSEGQSIVALEAMAAGKPVVASKVGGLPETVLDGETGRLIRSGDVGALAKSLIELLQNASQRGVYGRAGRLRVEMHFTLDRMIGCLEEVYTGVFDMRQPLRQRAKITALNSGSF